MKKIISTIAVFGFLGFTYAQDTPCTATPIAVGLVCTPVSGDNTGMTDSGIGGTCASYNGGDVWFSFTVPAGGEVTVNGDNNGGFTDGGLALYTGPNCSTLTAQGCNDDGGPGLHGQLSLTGLSPGTTVWARYWEYGNNSFGTFDICVVDDNPAPPAAPGNDDPCSATPLTVGASGACSMTGSTNAGATASAGVPAPGCANYSGGDVWFSVVVPASGNVDVDSDDAVITDGGMAIYSGACGSLTLIECDDDDSDNGAMAYISLTGQTPGATLYVRFWEYGNNNNGTFSICASEPVAPPPIGPCGNPDNNDYCSGAAILTQGGSSWESNTSSAYTADDDAGVQALFCGSMDNNSWYQFTAQSTTEVFNFTNVTNCTTGWGIQAEVFDVVVNGTGCCTSLSSVSNCMNPSVPTDGTVTASGLTIGNDYYLMVDGWGGDQCDFTVTGWSATGILTPVELISFNGITYPEYNLLKWTTASERNNDYFLMERSTDGINFESFGSEIKGQGTVVKYTDYTAVDENPLPGATYYRFKQVDFDGEFTYSDVIVLNRDIANIGALRTYPNPFEDNVKFQFNLSKGQEVVISFTDQLGKVVYSEIFQCSKGSNKIDLNTLFNSGIYIVKAQSMNGELNQSKKMIKN
jgi:hypothetical protein